MTINVDDLNMAALALAASNGGGRLVDVRPLPGYSNRFIFSVDGPDLTEDFEMRVSTRKVTVNAADVLGGIRTILTALAAARRNARGGQA